MKSICIFMLVLLGCVRCLEADDCCDPCESSCCEQNFGCWNLKVKSGVVPSFFTQRKDARLDIPEAGPLLTQKARNAQFHNQFHLPWLIGGEIGYLFTDCDEFFLDADYTYAKGKTYSYSSVTGTETFDVREKYGSLRQSSVYLGLRHYFYDLCWCIDSYLGVKAGFQHRDAVHQHATISSVGSIGKRPYYKNINTYSGGIQAGLSYSFCNCWKADLQVEVLAAGAMRNAIYELNPPRGGVTNVIIGETGTIISIPVTIGISASF